MNIKKTHCPPASAPPVKEEIMNQIGVELFILLIII